MMLNILKMGFYAQIDSVIWLLSRILPQLQLKKRFDSLGQDLVHLINLSSYCEISRSTLQFICYMFLAFLMWGCTSSFSSKYLLLQTEILTSDITTFQPCLYI